MEYSTWFFVVMGLVILLIGITKGGLGGAGGALSTPLTALVLPADRAIGILLPILILADAFALVSHWKGWDMRLIKLLMPGAIMGVITATIFITSISPEALRLGLGWVALLFVAYKIVEPKIIRGQWYQSQSWHGVFAGTVAGFASTLAHTGGPPISIYLILQKISPRTFVATSVLFFTLLNWIKVPTYFFAGLFNFQLFAKIVWLLPLLPAGVLLGKWAAIRVNHAVFERIIIVLLGVSAFLLLFE